MKTRELPAKFKFLIKDQDETFRLYVDRAEIGKRVLASLEKKRDGVDAFGNPVEGFYMSSRNKEVGLLSQVYGANAMFTLMNRYGIEMTDEQKAQIKDTLNYVISYIKENNNCYDLNPILDPEVNTELFVDGKNNYIGTMTWSLSLFCAARTAERRGVLELTEEERTQIFKNIRSIVRFFVNNVVGTVERPLGWGYANGCTEPSLFFTYSVVEAFADFDDNILNGGDLGPDDELIAFINTARNKDEANNAYTSQYENICYKIGDRAWDLYKDVLKTSFFSDNFSENFKLISRDEILNSSRSSVLFNTLYVIFTLFYSYTNARHKDTDGEEIVDSMTLALQMIQNFYDELRAAGKDSIVDRHIIAFDQPHAKIRDFGKLLNEETIQASPFLPMLVKANNLIAYYILEFPQQQMGELFDMMLEAQMEGDSNWLWDKRKYDILSTERYLESIADFFDYYDKFERNYADKSTTDARRRKEITAEITPRVEMRMKKNLEAAHRQDIENIKLEMDKNYPIEIAINERIERMIEDRAMGMLNEAIDVIIKYNNANQAHKAKIEESFKPYQKQLKEGLDNLMMSYFADDIRIKAQSANEMSELLLTESVKADMHKFMSAFVEFIAYNNANLPEDKKLSLADTFKLITNKN